MVSENLVMEVIRASKQSPHFRDDYDKIAFAVHAYFMASGYVLVAAGPMTASLFKSDFLKSATDEVGFHRWNEMDDKYDFLYVRPDKDPIVENMVMVRCVVRDDKLNVSAYVKEVSGPTEGFGPQKINVRDYLGEDEGIDYSSQFKNLEKLFKSLEELIKRVDHPFWSSVRGSSSGPSRQPQRYGGHFWPVDVVRADGSIDSVLRPLLYENFGGGGGAHYRIHPPSHWCVLRLEFCYYETCGYKTLPMAIYSVEGYIYLLEDLKKDIHCTSKTKSIEAHSLASYSLKLSNF